MNMMNIEIAQILTAPCVKGLDLIIKSMTRNIANA